MIGTSDPFDILMSQNFACGAIKESNLSPGKGHKFSDSRTIRGIKVTSSSPADVGNKFTVNYGPSPSVGKALTDNHTIGGIKDTGPSLDVRNKLTDSQTIDYIKASVEDEQDLGLVIGADGVGEDKGHKGDVKLVDGVVVGSIKVGRLVGGVVMGSIGVGRLVGGVVV
ncbi:hypothetical protein GOBAR_DD10983 [Gossypium barbadense]|nr:hypothetical protein GOBAR_DD10983 [Gossypium barbadense]